MKGAVAYNCVNTVKQFDVQEVDTSLPLPLVDGGQSTEDTFVRPIQSFDIKEPDGPSPLERVHAGKVESSTTSSSRNVQS